MTLTIELTYEDNVQHMTILGIPSFNYKFNKLYKNYEHNLVPQIMFVRLILIGILSDRPFMPRTGPFPSLENSELHVLSEL